MSDDTEIDGEYWVINGYVDFADGDVGDRNHEGIAIEHVAHQYASDVQNLAEELEIHAEIERYGETDTEELARVMKAIHSHLTDGPEDGPEPDPKTLMSSEQADAYIMKEIGCDPEAYSILFGGGDARLYAMSHYGWIAIRSNNVELYGYDASRQKEVGNAIGEILWEEGKQEHNPEEVEVSIYDHKTNRSWYTTLAELDSTEQVSIRPNQVPTTTYNRSLYHVSEPRDTEENKYSQKGQTRLPDWQGKEPREKWRGQSEWFSGFKKWFLESDQFVE